jgi:hypothetical protein
MIEINKTPSYTIIVYEGFVVIDNKKYEFRLDTGDSYAEVKWVLDLPYYTVTKLTELENQILKQFEQ